MKIKFFVLLSVSWMVLPLLSADVKVEHQTEFNPQIWPDNGNKFIYESIKNNMSELEDAFNEFYHKWGELHPYSKKKFIDAMIGINEIVGWLADQDPTNRKQWREELFKKITKIQNDFNDLGSYQKPIGTMSWSSTQLADLTALKDKISSMHGQIRLLNEPHDSIQGICASMRPFPLLFPDGGNKYIYDSIKWNTSRLEDDFNAFHHTWVNNLDPYHKDMFMTASIRLNEIVGWFNDQDFMQREKWHDELVSKYRQLYEGLSDFDRPYHAKKWTLQQRDAVGTLKHKVATITFTLKDIPGINTNTPGNDIQGLCAMLRLNEKYENVK